MKQETCLKIILTFTLLLLLCACGEKDKSTVGDTNIVVNYTVSPTAAEKATDDIADRTEEKESESGKEQVPDAETSAAGEWGRFRTGTWAVKKSDGSSVFLSFCKDKSIIRRNLSDGKEEFFRDGAVPEELYILDIEHVDEDRYIIHNNAGIEMVLDYVSAKAEEFSFCSDIYLRSKALGMAENLSDAGEVRVDSEIKESGCDKAVVIVKYGPAREYYEFNRITGEGKRINEK